MPVALDHAAAFAHGAARGADPFLLAECLPAFEAVLIRHMQDALTHG